MPSNTPSAMSGSGSKKSSAGGSSPPPESIEPALPPTRDAVDARDEDAAAPPDQALLDEALKETFPASDPISPSAAAAEGPAEPVPPAAPPSDEPIPFPTSESISEAKGGAPVIEGRAGKPARQQAGTAGKSGKGRKGS